MIFQVNCHPYNSKQIICMKCNDLFFLKIKKKIKMSSAAVVIVIVHLQVLLLCFIFNLKLLLFNLKLLQKHFIYFLEKKIRLTFHVNHLPKQTVHMKWQALFSQKNDNKI